MRAMLFGLVLVALSSTVFAESGSTLLACDARVTAGENVYEGQALYFIFSDRDSHLSGQYTSLLDGKFYKAFSVEIIEIGQHDAKEFISKDNYAQFLLSDLPLVPRNLIERITIFNINFDGTTDEGNMATFYRFHWDAGVSTKTAGIVGWGALAICK